MPIEISKITLTNIKELQRISKITFADTFGAENEPTDLQNYLNRAYSHAQLTNEINRPDSSFFFIKSDHQIAGYLKINVADAQTETMGPDALEIQRIYILPTFKRLGLGKQLIQHAISIAREHRKTTIWLGVWENNHDALAFYRKMGFTQIGDHVFIVGKSRQRDLLMSKQL